MMDRIKHIDYIIRYVPGYGYIPIIKPEDEKETYRGEYQGTPEKALDCIKERERGER